MKVRAAGLALVMMLLGAVGAQGQDGYEPVFTTQSILLNISWLYDSQSISFEEYHPVHGGIAASWNIWYEYNIDTGDLINGSLWPQPYFLPESMPLGLFTAPESTRYTFLSPNNRFVAYQTDDVNQSAMCNNLAIADREQFSGYRVENTYICSWGEFNQYFDVRWSDDGTAFTVRSEGVAPKRYYVTNYSESVDQVTFTDLYDFEISGEQIFADYPFDLNSDGSEVLMAAQGRLYRWLADSPDDSIIVAEGNSYPGAAFSPNNQRIWYIDRDGLHEYDLATEGTRLLTDDVNATWVDHAYFSPDGQYVALVRRDRPSNRDVSLYVEPMAQWLGADGA